MIDVWESVWVCHDDGDALHIWPPEDFVGHELNLTCPCGVIVSRLGATDLLVEHCALDGRP